MWPSQRESWSTWAGEVTSDLLKQWAAETTHSGLMMAPPQAGMEAKRRETCQGHEWAQASWPPMIRVSTSCSGLKARTPASSETQAGSLEQTQTWMWRIYETLKGFIKSGLWKYNRGRCSWFRVHTETRTTWPGHFGLLCVIIQDEQDLYTYAWTQPKT